MTRKRLPHFDFYPGDWLGDAKVRAMSAAERGYYIDILSYMWEHNEGRDAWEPLPTPAGRLARMVGAPPKQWRRFAEAFIGSEGPIFRTPEGLNNARLEYVFGQALERVERASLAGSKSAEARRVKAAAVAAELERQANLEATSHQSPVTSHQSPEREEESTTSDGDGDNLRQGLHPDQVKHMWNTIAYPAGLQKLEHMTDDRRRRIHELALVLPDEILWAKFINRCAESDYLCGRLPEKEWGSDFDFVTKPQSQVDQILNGKYGNDRRPKNRRGPRNAVDDLLEYGEGEGLEDEA